jgi:hypothetical protein
LFEYDPPVWTEGAAEGCMIPIISFALTLKMPPKRTPWESEDYRMSMFTAATLAMAQPNITGPSAPAIPGPLASPFSPKAGAHPIEPLAIHRWHPDPPRDYFQPAKQDSNHL